MKKMLMRGPYLRKLSGKMMREVPTMELAMAMAVR